LTSEKWVHGEGVQKSYSASTGLRRWGYLIRMTDGRRAPKPCHIKQKLVEIPKIEEIAFHCRTHCTLLTTKYPDTQSSF